MIKCRKRQKIISNVAGDGEEHSMIWWMFFGCNNGISDIHGENFQDNQNSIMNSTDLTLKQMFGITAKLVAELRWDLKFRNDLVWKNIHGNICPLIGDERIINLQRAKVCVFSDSVLCLGKDPSTTKCQRILEEQDRMGSQLLKAAETMMESVESRPNSSGKIFSVFDTLQLYGKVKDLLSRLWQTPENFTGRILFMSMFKRHFLWNKRQWTRMSGTRSSSVLVCKEVWYRTTVIHWSSFRKKWYSINQKRTVPQGIWDNIAEKMFVGIRRKRMSDFPCNNSIVQELTQKQRTRKTVNSLCRRPRNNWDYFFA